MPILRNLENLIEALNEATLDPGVRARLARDPMEALRALDVSIPDGVTVQVVERPNGLMRLILTELAPCELSDDALDGVVGGAGLSHLQTTGPVLASWDLAA